jgi:hypothetical protein
MTVASYRQRGVRTKGLDGRCRQERLAAQSGGHHARNDWQRYPIDLEGRRASHPVGI